MTIPAKIPCEPRCSKFWPESPEKKKTVMQRGDRTQPSHAKHHDRNVRMNKKKWKAIHRSCPHMGQMILTREVDLTVPKWQSHSRTGNENKSKQAASPKQPPPSGYSHLRTSKMCGTVGSMQLQKHLNGNTRKRSLTPGGCWNDSFELISFFSSFLFPDSLR